MKLAPTDEIRLENDRVLLRPLIEDDLNNLAPIAYKNKTLLQFSPSQIFSKDLLEQYIDKAWKERQAGTRYPFIIFDKKKESYAGSTSYLNIDRKNNRVEIGHTWIGEEFQRTGLNYHMKYFMLQYAFEDLEFERVEFKTDERNAQSRRAIEKLGASYEGLLRSHTVMSDGFRRNTVYYSILREEWESVKDQLDDHITQTKA